MEEDIIDIDGDHDDLIDIESPIPAINFYASAGPSTTPPEQQPVVAPPGARPVTVASQLAAPAITTRRSSRSTTSTPPVIETSDRTTRSATQHTRPRFQPKLKLKVSERQASGTSFLGPYDRELDSDDEDLAFEEQFILRMPAGADCEKLRGMVESREVTKDVWFKFKGEHRC